MVTNVSIAQVRFNYNYPYQSIENFATGIVPIGNGYLCFEQISNYDSVFTGIGIRKIDNSGVEQWIKILMTPQTALYPGHKDYVQIVNNNLLLISGGYEDTVYTPKRMQGIIISINAQGDSLRSVSLGSPWQDFFTSSLLDSDNNLISVGLYSTSSSTYDAWAVKTDTMGNVIWDKKFGGGNGDIFYSVVQAPDGGYYIAGASNSYAGINNSDIYLVKIDIDGNLIWQKNIPNTSTIDVAAGMVISNNKIYLTGVAKQTIGNGLLAITDLDGNLIRWQEFGSDNLNEEFMTKPLALINGDIIVAGFTRTHYTNNQVWGWLFKFNQDGDSIWSRTYYNNPNAPNYIYDLKATADGGFIMAGSANDSLGGVGAQNTWVLKVDEFGCEVENCQMYDEIKEQKENAVELKIYPNPNNGNFSLEYPVSQSSGWLYVYDINCKEVYKDYVSPFSSIKNLQLSGLTKGIYAISLVFGKERFLGKFVVN